MATPDRVAGSRAAFDRLVREQGEQASRLRFVTVDELLRQPPQIWRVLHVIPGRGLIVLWGASGSGKTFTVLDLAVKLQ